MSIRNIITKLLDNQQLTVLERAELEQFDPDKLSGELEELKARNAEFCRISLRQRIVFLIKADHLAKLKCLFGVVGGMHVPNAKYRYLHAKYTGFPVFEDS